MEELKDKIINIFETNLYLNKSGELFTKLREDDKIEFKKSLQISNESLHKSYLKTICGFANNRGGLIVFGINQDTHQVVGIKSKFEEIDNRFSSTLINDGVDGTFLFTNFIWKFHGVLVGFLFVKKAKSKPVLLRIDFQDGENLLKNGDIYYRYPGRTRRILASDLRSIIQEEIDSKTKMVLNKMAQLVELGPDNSAILDKLSGEVLQIILKSN
jgi:predicted HTH transcriptional regulator